MSELSIFVDESGEWGKLSEYYLITLVLHVPSDSVAEHIDKYERHLADSGLPDFHSMLVHCLVGMTVTKTFHSRTVSGCSSRSSRSLVTFRSDM